MATPQPQIQGEITRGSSRLVWVLNRDEKPYTATFQGLTITIPAEMEKIAKHVRDGGNMMEYLAARRFITDLKQAQGYLMDSMGKPQPQFGPKMLLDRELTDEEYQKHTGKTPASLKKEAIADEKKARKKLSQELMKVSNKVEVTAEDEDE